jgi:hypothetical protein
MTRAQAEMLAPPPPAVTREQRQRELEQRLIIVERDERLRLEVREQFPKDVAAMEAFYAEKAEEKAAVKALKKADREDRRAKKASRKKEREEKSLRKAARKKEEKKNGAGPSTIVVSSSSSFDWTTSPVSSTTSPLVSGTPSTRSSLFLVYLLCSGAGNVISSYFLMLKKLSIMFWCWR